MTSKKFNEKAFRTYLHGRFGEHCTPVFLQSVNLEISERRAKLHTFDGPERMIPFQHVQCEERVRKGENERWPRDNFSNKALITHGVLKPNEKQFPFYIPKPWTAYQGAKSLVLVESSMDALTFLLAGQAAIGCRSWQSIKDARFFLILNEFLSFTGIESLTIIPDVFPAFDKWVRAFATALNGSNNYQFVDFRRLTKELSPPEAYDLLYRQEEFYAEGLNLGAFKKQLKKADPLATKRDVNWMFQELGFKPEKLLEVLKSYTVNRPDLLHLPKKPMRKKAPSREGGEPHTTTAINKDLQRDVLSKFNAVKRSGSVPNGCLEQYYADCPICRNNLSISLKTDGKTVLYHCHAGCDGREVAASVDAPLFLDENIKPVKKKRSSLSRAKHTTAPPPTDNDAPGGRTVSDDVRRATIGVLTRKRKDVFQDLDSLNSFLKACKGEGCEHEDVKRLCTLKQWQAITPVNHGAFGYFVKLAKQTDSTLYSTLKKQGEQTGEVGKAELMARFLKANHEFEWNELELCPYIDGVQLTDDIESELYVECHNAGHKGKALMQDVIITECKKNRVHPVKQYLESLEYDGKPHIKKFTDHVKDSKGLSYTLFRKWMIQTVKKIYEASQNEVLVLVGGQNAGKSYLVEWLCPPALKEYYVECGGIDPANKDHQIQATSNFFGEIGELGSTTKKKEVRALKDFLTKKYVKTRPPYGKRDVKKAVTMSYIGTENEDGTGFLNDPTGNRRYTVLDIIHIDWKYTKNCDVDQMWSEAYAAYANGEKTDLSKEDKALMQGLIEAHTVQTVEREYLLSYLEFTLNKEDKMMALAIFKHMENVGYKVPQEKAFYRIARELKSMGIQGEKGRNGKIYFGIKPLRYLQSVTGS